MILQIEMASAQINIFSYSILQLSFDTQFI